MTKGVDINQLLDEIIRQTGLTQEQLSEEIGYDQSYLSQARKAGTQKLYNKLLAYQEKSKKSQKTTSVKSQSNNKEMDSGSRDLETAIKNLTEADLINSRNIERLISLLEDRLKYSPFPEPGAHPSVETMTEQKKSRT